ncbi:G-type lectin S-receptor-like serine/threonine-protein kinase CES101 [Cucumis melo var. makuwa]|uniref:Receptor-like serine/threonine-protein kinase n=1 Tax=Cucumis melo var. makuwa TaxID=1194695 RepID=A0A5A7UZ65_CUCMM|nr:G-type lectin S-receptor-like serine/threonine-protein kinase CES101 [Cucumis melo var. makuwa]TYK10575.1 G-type lectin S-receptor-like serine/threonine-protein kinase CES101 [Cucumis melo var. makuwa]
MATSNEIMFNCFVLLLLMAFSNAQSDVLAQGQEITPGSTLISAMATFSLGFYSPSLLNNSYIAIWYQSDPLNPVWIANRNFAFPRDFGTPCLTIDGNGSLKIVPKEGTGRNEYNFSLFEVGEPTNSSAILLDNGNFVLCVLNPDGSIKRQLWQSFDHPTDTLLPGMKLGINHKTGSIWSITSRRGDYSVLSGSFTLTVNPNNTNQLLILHRGSIFWTSGNWQDGRFEFSEELSNINNQEFVFNRFSNENETFFNYSISSLFQLPNHNKGLIEVQTFLRLGNDGKLVGRNWDSKVECPYFENELFEPKNVSEVGCVGRMQHKVPECRNPPKQYSTSQRFGNMEGNGLRFGESENLTIYDCEKNCISSCDCIAFSSTNEEGTGCEMWNVGATFIPVEGGKRIIWSLEVTEGKGEKRVWLQVTIGLIVPVTSLLLCFLVYLKWKTQIIKAIRKTRRDSEHQNFLQELGIPTIMNKQRRDIRNSELQFFSFRSVVSTTNNFADNCKLGEGGFGPVYKGTLADGQEVAIKRLSRKSGQGIEEFKNEVILIAKLQHTNLVRLIGCCIHKEERLLVYEYMPNKSLDSFLFDPVRKLNLDWDKRQHIIQGIIQGLLYLHNYSRLRIVHRDLKVSNILLDGEMNAKISDFGMARIFDLTKEEANTNHIVGTYGYISPENALGGVFSLKSDVYSFGVLLLEIITARKNYDSYDAERPMNLIGYAWELWVNGRGEELIDSTLCNSDEKAKALRCIHVSLLCVQQMPVYRPTMLDVYSMIQNDSTQLPLPKPPPFFITHNSKLEVVTDKSESATQIYSSNDMSVSVMVAR